MTSRADREGRLVLNCFGRMSRPMVSPSRAPHGGSLTSLARRAMLTCSLGPSRAFGHDARRVYSAISRRSASRPACVSFNLVPRSSSSPHPFKRWIATQSISRSSSSPSATCFNVSFSDGLRRAWGDCGAVIGGRIYLAGWPPLLQPYEAGCSRSRARRRPALKVLGRYRPATRRHHRRAYVSDDALLPFSTTPEQSVGLRA